MTCCPRRPWNARRSDLPGSAGNRRANRLLLRDWTPVAADQYLTQHADHLEVGPAFWARHAKRAQATGEALVIMHSCRCKTETW